MSRLGVGLASRSCLDCVLLIPFPVERGQSSCDCRIRKVKCDEGKPSCRRCLSTGRVCDGYGVWGGGGKFCGENQARSPSDPNLKSPTHDNSPSPGNISVLVISATEEESLDWLRCRIVTKLPGSFISGFWTTLLLQASLSEPAVMHAVLALTSVHRGGILEDDNQMNSDTRLETLQQFSLQHYIKAIKGLQTLNSMKEKTTIRTALIACIVFVSIDFLRGHFTTALIHLQNGLKLLGETEAVCYRSGKVLLLRPGRESIDDWIGEAFCRLYIQVQLFKQPHQSSYLLLRTVDPILPGDSFNSFKEAWHLIEWLLNQTFYLSRLARDHQTNSAHSPHVLAMLEHQKRVQAALEQWLITYETSKTTLQAIELPEGKIPYALLHTYHTMADIMACICLCPGDEGVFDSYTYKFVKIVGNLTDLFKGRLGDIRVPEPTSHPFTMASSIIDMGCIPPLYYTVCSSLFSFSFFHQNSGLPKYFSSKYLKVVMLPRGISLYFPPVQDKTNSLLSRPSSVESTASGSKRSAPSNQLSTGRESGMQKSWPRFREK